MASTLKHNPYPGVNAHLNSVLQTRGGGWENFHVEHITTLRRVLDALLPENYVAGSEKSLQVNEIGLEKLRRSSTTRPDIGVFKLRDHSAIAPQSAVTAPTLTMPLDGQLDEAEDFLHAVNIYEVSAGALKGHLVTRIEVLSPGNKPSHDYHDDYMEKRAETLRAGVNLVELDYLHTTHPILSSLPSYRDGDADAFPYSILVSYPHQQGKRGRVEFYGVGVDDPLPTILLPLRAPDGVAVDFSDVYHRTYAETRLLQVLVDYAQEPPQFERYRHEDRERIRARMATIVDATE